MGCLFYPVVLALAVCLGQRSMAVTFEAQEATCGLNFQDILMKAVDQRKNCDNAAYRDCCQAKRFDPAASSGPYEIYHTCESRPFNFGMTKVYAACDMETDEGGWVVIMKRFNGSVHFNRSLEEYKYGFGDITGEFWYGLKNIHCLTYREPVALRIEIGNGTEPSIVWEYPSFTVGPDPYYALSVGTGKGIGGTYDAFYQHRGQRFYTYDRDTSRKCATSNGGTGWWFRTTGTCHYANLNGRYEPVDGSASLKLSWYKDTSSRHVHYTHATMKVRPKSCAPCEV